jgi:hypothetical protein
MEINYFIFVPILFIAIVLMRFLIKRNWKDEKKFEEDLNKDTGEPENHSKDRI